MSKQQNRPNRIGLAEDHVSRSLRYPLITEELSKLSGEILTLIDAAITDPQQNKAVKDLVREKFSHAMHGTFWEYCYRSEFKPDGAFEKENIVDGVIKFGLAQGEKTGAKPE